MMSIRPGEPADHERLVQIWLSAVRATHAFLTEEDIQVLLPIVRESALAGLEIWVLCHETGEAIGFMGLSGSDVKALFIAPSWTRRGGGRLLLDHARWLKGSRLTVDVNEENLAAARFYVACGFRVTGRSDLDEAGRPFPLLHMRREQ
jgi:putative acetyltransferase